MDAQLLNDDELLGLGLPLLRCGGLVLEHVRDEEPLDFPKLADWNNLVYKRLQDVFLFEVLGGVHTVHDFGQGDERSLVDRDLHQVCCRNF